MRPYFPPPTPDSANEEAQQNDTPIDGAREHNVHNLI